MTQRASRSRRSDGWLKRWRGPWDQPGEYEERRQRLLEEIRWKNERAKDKDQTTIPLSPTSWNLIEWALYRLPDLAMAERRVEALKDLYTNAADILTKEKRTPKTYKKALSALGLDPEDLVITYPVDLLHSYALLVTSTGPVLLPTPLGLVIKDQDLMEEFEAPMEPIAAVFALTRLYGAANAVACRKRLERLCKDLAERDPEAAKKLKKTLPTPKALELAEAALPG